MKKQVEEIENDIKELLVKNIIMFFRLFLVDYQKIIKNKKKVSENCGDLGNDYVKYFCDIFDKMCLLIFQREVLEVYIGGLYYF